jgi:type IV pilus assembly protein PilQ
MIELSRRLVVAMVMLLILTSCESARTVFDNTLINQDPLIDKKVFIDQSKARAENTIKFGPKIEKKTDSELRSSFQTHVNKEYAPSSVELRSDGNWNVFPIDINAENMDMALFAEMMSRITGNNIIVSDEVKGKVTIKLKNVPWPNVMDSVLQMKGLAKYIDTKAKIIRIHDQNTVVQIEDFKRRRQENLYKARELEKATEPKYTEIFKLFYTKPADIKTTLEGVLGKASESGGDEYLNSTAEITIDERLNLLIVKAREDDIKLATKIIKKLDSRTKQVFIEAFIVEVTDGFQDEFGVRLGLHGNDSLNAGKDVNYTVTGLAGDAASAITAGDSGATLSNLAASNPFGGIGLLAGIGGAANLKVELTAMEAEGLSRVVSNPRIFTLDNQEATIFQGDEVPFETTSQDGTKVEFKEAGLKLAVIPNVIGDGNLLMNITVNKDTVDTSQSNPPISKSEIKTSLISRDGDIVVIGGIYNENKSHSKDQVPFFGDLPGVGKLFKREAKKDNRSELIIFIAPRIL